MLRSYIFTPIDLVEIIYIYACPILFNFKQITMNGFTKYEVSQGEGRHDWDI